MDSSSEPGSSRIDADEYGAFRQAALVVGAVSAAFVFFTSVLPWLLTELVLALVYDPTTGAIPSWLSTVTAISVEIGHPGAVLLGILLAFYLTAGRDLPVAPVVAGAFLGAALAPVAHLLALVTVVPQDLTGFADAFFRFASVTVVFVVPVLLAALFGAVIDDVWERGARFWDLAN